MVLCYVHLQEHVLNLDEAEIDAMFLRPAAECKVEVLIQKVEEPR